MTNTQTKRRGVVEGVGEENGGRERVQTDCVSCGKGFDHDHPSDACVECSILVHISCALPLVHVDHAAYKSLVCCSKHCAEGTGAKKMVDKYVNRDMVVDN